MSLFLGISRLIDWLNETIGRFTAWAIVLAVVVSALNAIIRKVFAASSNSWLELQWYLFGAVFMLCAAWTLKANEHIRIDILSNKLSKRARDWIDVFGHVFFFFPFVALMVWLSGPFFWRSYSLNEFSSNAGGLVIWPAKGLILAGFILLAMQGLSELIKRIAVIRGEIQDARADGGHLSSAEAEAQRLLAELAEAEQKPPVSGATRVPH